MEKDKCKSTGLPLTAAEWEAMDTEKGLGGCTSLDDGVQVIIDNNFVSIPLTRYEELVRAETELDVMLRVYKAMTNYDVAAVLEAIFGPKLEDSHA